MKPKLRLLPISGGGFAGVWKSGIAALTAEAIHYAYRRLEPWEQERVVDLDMVMCVWEERELAAFETAWRMMETQGGCASLINETAQAAQLRVRPRLRDPSQRGFADGFKPAERESRR